jgi:hypothetical protein
MEGNLEPDAHREWLAYCGEAEAGRLRSGNADDPTFLSMVVADLADVGAAPALDTLRGWYADGLVDPSDVSLQEPYRREDPKVGRNEPCPCGSGRKYKKCCGAG